MSGGFIINGRVVRPRLPNGAEIPVVNYRDDRRLQLATEDRRPRGESWIRNITAHTTSCYPTKVEPGLGPNRSVEVKVASWWRVDGRKAGAHFTVDYDGSIGQHCDLVMDASRNAGSLNSRTIGFEIAKRRDPKGVVYLGQLQRCVEVVDWLCRHFGIQRQCVHPDQAGKLIPRIVAGGRDVVGVVGHQHQSVNKHGGQNKPNDPGAQFFELLVMEGGFLPFRFTGKVGARKGCDDKDFWRPHQKELWLDQDGVPGPVTTGALEDVGHPDGLLMLAEAPEL